MKDQASCEQCEHGTWTCKHPDHRIHGNYPDRGRLCPGFKFDEIREEK